MNWQKILGGVATGFFVSVVVDLREWLRARPDAGSNQPPKDFREAVIWWINGIRDWLRATPDGRGGLPPFDFREAIPRWMIGIVMGAAAGAGIVVD